MFNDQVLDLIEDRIKNLELKIYGKKDYTAVNTSSYKPIIQTLNEANTVLISKLSGRNKLNELLKKVQLIEKLLDPLFGETLNETEAKTIIILDEEANVRQLVNSLSNLSKLEYTLDKEPFTQIVPLENRIALLSLQLLKNKELTDIQERKINNMAKEYNEIMFQFTQLFAQLDTFITNYEIHHTSKKSYKSIE